MRTKLIFCLMAGLTVTAITGCISTVDGRKTAGVPFSKDKVEGRYEKSPQDLWLAAKDVLLNWGTITGEDTERSVLEANVDTRTVWVKVEEVDPKVSRVIVQARKKGGGGDQALAAFIDKEIAVRLATGNLTPASPGHRAF